jgi:hypothetical protein
MVDRAMRGFLGAILCAIACGPGAAQTSGGDADASRGALASAFGTAISAVGTAWTELTDWEAWRRDDHFRLAVSPYTAHFRPSEEHEYVWAIGVERERDDQWLGGFSFFSNSFGQPSAYLYGGRRHYGLFDRPEFFFQWSVGLLYGYKDEYEEKVPLNVNGFSPGALIGVGWQFGNGVSTVVHLLGDASLMFQLSYDLR